jgi:hypothetical protein
METTRMSTSKKTTREFRAGLEALERREVLSTASATAHVLPFAGAGTATLVSSTPDPSGWLQTMSTLNGKASGIGLFIGDLTTRYFGPHGLNSVAQGMITTSDGSELDFQTTGTNRPTQHGASHTSGTIAFNVTGGTGDFAGATGSGQIHGITSLIKGTVHFTIQGRVVK